MKKKRVLLIAGAAVLLAAGILTAALLAGGKENRASAMWLVRAEGSVAVTDGGGKDVPVRSMAGMELRLGLYDGYAVGTERESYGWINLDDTKLTKLDQDSAVEINRDGRALELVVERGSLFFNVTRPLEEDETLEIRSSNMVMAVRGTCGWVRAVDGDTFDVYIIEGKVRCTARTDGAILPAVEQVTAGQTARLSIKDGQPAVAVRSFEKSEIPEFVLDEAREDPDVSEKLASIGMDAGDAPGEPSGGPAGPEDGGDAPSGGDVPPGADDGPEDGDSQDRLTYVMKQAVPDLAQELPHVTFTYPYFSGAGAVAENINAYMDTLLQEFLVRSRDIDMHIEEFPNTDLEVYESSQQFSVNENRQGLIILNGLYVYNDGRTAGGHYSTTSTLAFDAGTGENLGIPELMGCTDQEAREAIKAALYETAYGPRLPLENVDSIDLSTLDWSLSGNEIRIDFDFSRLGGGLSNLEEGSTFYLPLSSRYGGEGPDPLAGPQTSAEVPAELASFYTGDASLLTPENAGILAARMRTTLDTAAADYDGEGSFTARACLFTLDGRPAAMIIGGGQDAADPDLLLWPVTAGFVYIKDGEGVFFNFSYNFTGYVYDGGLYTTDFNGYNIHIQKYAGESVLMEDMEYGVQNSVTTDTGFGRDGRNRVIHGMFNADQVIGALESFAG